MNNPRTVDRRDVAHPTNPIGGHEHIEELSKLDRVKAVDPKSDKSRADAQREVTPRIPQE